MPRLSARLSSAPVAKRPLPAAAFKSSDPDFMLSLARGLSVIRAFGDATSPRSVADIARTTGLSRAAARRCLHTLSVLGYAVGSNGLYRLGPAILALGYAYLRSTSLAGIAAPILQRVSDELQESCSLAVLDGEEIVYVARAATRKILSISLSVGSRLPAACTSMGRVLLANLNEDVEARVVAGLRLQRHTAHTIVDRDRLRAELQRVRAEGHAIVDQELELGLRSVAVPVRRPDGTTVAAINVGVQTGRADLSTLRREFVPRLEAAAAEIGSRLPPEGMN